MITRVTSLVILAFNQNRSLCANWEFSNLFFQSDAFTGNWYKNSCSRARRLCVETHVKCTCTCIELYQNPVSVMQPSRSSEMLIILKIFTSSTFLSIKISQFEAHLNRLTISPYHCVWVSIWLILNTLATPKGIYSVTLKVWDLQIVSDSTIAVWWTKPYNPTILITLWP